MRLDPNDLPGARRGLRELRNLRCLASVLAKPFRYALQGAFEAVCIFEIIIRCGSNSRIQDVESKSNTVCRER